MKQIDNVTKDILIELRMGNHEAFKQVYLLYINNLIVFLQMLLRSRAEAEEIAQEVFARIWETREDIDPEKNIKNYIFTFAKRLAIDRMRHQVVIKKHLSEALVSLDQTSTAPDQQIILKERELECLLAIDHMPPKQREIFVMSRFDEMSDDELSEKFHISKRTVQTHIYNATKYLRKAFPAQKQLKDPSKQLPEKE